MKSKTIVVLCLLSLLVIMALPGVGLAQGGGQQPAASEKKAEIPTVALTGKVVYNQRTHNYMFQQEEPPYSEFFIMNQNVEELKALAASQQKVKVEGLLPHGADSLLIDKIDGKKFSQK